MADRGFDFVLLSKRANFAWLTCGGLSHVNQATERGEVSILLGAGGERFVLANRIEAPRLNEEKIDRLEYEVRVFPWFEKGAFSKEIQGIAGKGRIASDTPLGDCENLPEDFWKLRNPLLPDEIERYRKVGYDASVALMEGMRSAGPGYKEFEIEAIIAASCLKRQLRTPVLLVACGDRIDRYRHPLPKEVPYQDRMMAVLCAERGGLIVNLTRFLYTRRIPKTLDRRHEAVAAVAAAAIAASRPGRRLGEVFDGLVKAYAKAGYPDEWQLLHQGGPTGYATRDLHVTGETAETVMAGQALAWNPSLPGVKSEDTILVTEKGFDILTRGEDWDYVAFDTEEGTVERPWPLVI